jgi:hypothetical protein
MRKIFQGLGRRVHRCSEMGSRWQLREELDKVQLLWQLSAGTEL